MLRSSRRALRELERMNLASKGEPPINLVPMIDILTTLVLYLLVGTIFKQFTVLQLNLPGPAAAADNSPPPLQLKVTLREDRLELSDGRGTIKLVPNTADGYDLVTLGTTLADIKRRAPSEDSVTLLLEPQVKYDMLVQVMDTARVFPEGSDERKAGTPLFPSIGIGDAPKAAGGK